MGQRIFFSKTPTVSWLRGLAEVSSSLKLNSTFTSIDQSLPCYFDNFLTFSSALYLFSSFYELSHLFSSFLSRLKKLSSASLTAPLTKFVSFSRCFSIFCLSIKYSFSSHSLFPLFIPFLFPLKLSQKYPEKSSERLLVFHPQNTSFSLSPSLSEYLGQNN